MTTKTNPVPAPAPDPIQVIENHPLDSGVSANSYFRSPKQPPGSRAWQLTIRSHATEEDLYNVLNLIGLFEQTAIEEDHWTYDLGASAVVAEAVAAALPTDGGASALPVDSPPGGPAPGGTGRQHTDTTFLTKSVKMNKDGRYWTIVSAANYPKFPTPVDDDVLIEAGINPDKLDPTLTYKLEGWTAHFVRNEKGNPRAVVKLVKGS